MVEPGKGKLQAFVTVTSPNFLNGLLSFPEVSKGKPLKIKEEGWGVSTAGVDGDVTFTQLGVHAYSGT